MTEKIRFEPEDLLLEQRITDLHVIPDQPLAICAVKSIDTKTKQYDVSLWSFSMETGEARRFTQGSAKDDSPRWAPDGRQIAFLSDRAKKGTPQVHLMPIDGGEARQLSHLQRGATMLSWRPDGKKLLVIGNVTVDPSQRAEGCQRGDGAESIEVMPGDLQWNRDSREVAFIQVARGLQQIAAISVPAGEVRCVVGGDRHIDRLAANDWLVYSSETPASPLELFCNRWDDGAERQLSHFNDWWHERITPQVAYRRFEVPDGDGGTEAIDGWLLTPGDADAARPGPLLVDAHGGPAAYVQLKFSTHPYWQILCSRGWSVLALNPVGSSSYGRDFSERLRERWGELDLPQHLAAVAQLRREGIAGEQVAITGSSYGGYLSAYAIGHSREFRAAVVCAPVANMESHFGTSDSGYYADAYSTDGEPDEQRELLARLSPMTTIEQVRTPTLFLQGADDERCPRGQSEELFVKLKRAGCAPAEMVLYPGGSHHVFGEGKPKHRLDIQHRIVEWLERWIEQPIKQ